MARDRLAHLLLPQLELAFLTSPASLPLPGRAEELIAQGRCFSLKNLAVNGRDVIAAGVAPGPAVGRALNGLLEQVLSGQAPNERLTSRS